MNVKVGSEANKAEKHQTPEGRTENAAEVSRQPGEWSCGKGQFNSKGTGIRE